MSVIPFPKHPRHRRNDAKARAWLGNVIGDLKSPIVWKDKYYKMLPAPNSVTFPICAGCGCIIWDWPHFEEEVPEECACEDCANDDQA